MKNWQKKKEEVAEDYCFICKDGGLLLVCEYKDCLKAYHPECVGKDSMFVGKKDRWICSWHSCFICQKPSVLQCVCCPSSVCRSCVKIAEFVHVRGKKGFCNNCLKIALLIEENVDIDSDGGKIDFEDRETYECLFKEYWEIINEKESFSLEDLRNADALLKKGENSEDRFSSYKLPEDGDELISDIDKMDNEIEDQSPSFKVSERRGVLMKTMSKGFGSRRMEFIGWGSRKLIEFLLSIGENTEKPLSLMDVHDMILHYIQENNLHHPHKKKKVLCDVKLRALLGRKEVNRLKISSILERHFLENLLSEEESPCESEDANVSSTQKRQQRSSSNAKTYKSVRNACREEILEVTISYYASVTKKNIELVYLRRSLIEKFLKDTETFESKLIDCFVRVKSDPKDYLSRYVFQLLQVTGVKRAPEPYMLGNIKTNILLQVSNMVEDIRISLISDDDFSEEECEDLCQKVNQGLVKRPILAEVERKARSLHEEITNHWIDKEIVKLQNQIDRANEKGWRREFLTLFEYLERKQLLQTPEERSRRLMENPKVLPDAEIQAVVAGAEIQANETQNAVDDACGNSEGNRLVCHEKTRKRGRPKGSKTRANKNAAERESEGSFQQTAATFTISSHHDRGRPLTRIDDISHGIKNWHAESISEEPDEREAEGIRITLAASGPHSTEIEDSGRAEAFTPVAFQKEHDQFRKANCSPGENVVDLIESDEDLVNEANKVNPSTEVVVPKKETVEENSRTEVIELDDDQEGQSDVAMKTASATVENAGSKMEDEASLYTREKGEDSTNSSLVWHYEDPSGNIQGPFSLSHLRGWKDNEYFDEKFMVWQTGQSKQDAVLLTDALRIVGSTHKH